MLKTLEGVYEQGTVKLKEDPQYTGTSKVLVIFLEEAQDKENQIEERNLFLEKTKGILSGDGDYKRAKQEVLDEKY